MDYDTIKNLVQSQEAVYVAATAVASSVILGIGYVAGRFRSSNRLEHAKLNNTLELSVQETERSRLQLEIAKQSTAAELERLKYENADGEAQRQISIDDATHKRKLATNEQENDFKVQQESRNYSVETELRRTQAAESQLEHDRNFALQQAREVEHQIQYDRRKELLEMRLAHRKEVLMQVAPQLGPFLQRYLDLKVQYATNGENPAYVGARAEFKQQLMDKLIDKFGDDLFDDDTDLDQAKQKVTDLVELAFPDTTSEDEPEIELPEEISRLVKVVSYALKPGKKEEE